MKLASESQVVALGSERDGDLATEENESEQITVLHCQQAINQQTHLGPAVEQELVGVHTVRGGRAKQWNPVKDDRGQSRVYR